MKKVFNPRIETGYASTKDVQDKPVEKYNNQTSDQGSAILKIKYYNPKKLIVQQNPIKEKLKKLELFLCVLVIL